MGFVGMAGVPRRSPAIPVPQTGCYYTTVTQNLLLSKTPSTPWLVPPVIPLLTESADQWPHPLQSHRYADKRYADYPVQRCVVGEGVVRVSQAASSRPIHLAMYRS